MKVVKLMSCNFGTHTTLDRMHACARRVPSNTRALNGAYFMRFEALAGEYST